MSKMTNENGNKVWRNKEGQYHRVDGPAFIHANGSQTWFIDGLRHRLDGPAIIYENGTQAWWVDGKCHRLDGPAVIYANGSQYWFVNGFGINDQVDEWIKENNFPDYALWTDGQKMMFLLAFSGMVL